MKHRFSNHNVLTSAQRSAGTGTTNTVNASSEEYVFVETIITAKSGAPTLDLTLQCSPVDPNIDNTKWATAAVESQITSAAIGTTYPKIFRSVAHPDFVGWVRVFYKVAGASTPKITFAINLQTK